MLAHLVQSISIRYDSIWFYSLSLILILLSLLFSGYMVQRDYAIGYDWATYNGQEGITSHTHDSKSSSTRFRELFMCRGKSFRKDSENFATHRKTKYGRVPISTNQPIQGQVRSFIYNCNCLNKANTKSHDSYISHMLVFNNFLQTQHFKINICTYARCSAMADLLAGWLIWFLTQNPPAILNPIENDRMRACRFARSCFSANVLNLFFYDYYYCHRYTHLYTPYAYMYVPNMCYKNIGLNATVIDFAETFIFVWIGSG